VLALAQVQQRHHRRLLVLRRVPLQDLGDQPLVQRVELEGDRRVVGLAVAVLSGEGDIVSQRNGRSARRSDGCSDSRQLLTTKREPLRDAVVEENGRRRGRAIVRDDRASGRLSTDTNLEAMRSGEGENG